MRIGIIVHSHTGNTLSVAKRLEDALMAAGHTVSLEQITALNEDPSAAKTTHLKTAPEASKYDALVLGAPVRGMSLSPVMILYLSGLSTIRGKNACLFVTQQFPSAALGGNRAVKQMKEVCQKKGAAVLKTGVINWSNKKREQQIVNLINDFTKLC